MHVSLERVLSAPLEQMFTVVSDITRRPEWVGIAHQRTRIGEGPPGAGAEYRAVDKMPGSRVEYVQRIEQYEPHSLFVESWDGPMAGRSTMRFSDEGGHTRSSVDADQAIPPPFSLIPPLARTLGNMAIGTDLKRLEALVRDRV